MNAAYPTVQADGVVTHVMVPVEEYRKLSAAAAGSPTPDQIAAAVKIWKDPKTEWHEGEAALHKILRDGVKEARESCGISQAELGKCVGVSQSQISRAESNPDGLTVEMLKRIAEVLGKRG